MTALQLPIIPILFLYHKPLLAPVLQHLPHGVLIHVGTLHGHRTLHRLLERELEIQTLIDGVVPAALRSFSIQVARIVATHESVLDTVAEEVEGILNERISNHVIDLQHRELLRAIVAVRLGISYYKINLRALDAAYSIAFPKSTPININKKKKNHVTKRN